MTNAQPTKAWVFTDQWGYIGYQTPHRGLIIEAKAQPLRCPGFDVSAPRYDQSGYGVRVYRRPLRAFQFGHTPTACFGHILGSELRCGYESRTDQFQCVSVHDATAALQEFTRLVARQVLHLWTPPDSVLAYIDQGLERSAPQAWIDAREQASIASYKLGVNKTMSAELQAARASIWACAVADHQVMEAAQKALSYTRDAWKLAWTEKGWDEEFVTVSLDDFDMDCNDQLESMLIMSMAGFGRLGDFV